MDIGANTPQEPEDATPKVAAPAAFDPSEVGAELRSARIALERELSDVAGELRIRQIYLQAIEEGRLSDLPGPAYTTGFLRAYGDYLGLNGKDMVSRFKAAGGPSSGQPNLHLPSPVQEGRLPTGSVLLLAALIAVGAYGGWYYMASTGEDPVEKVAALPDRLATMINEPTDTFSDEPTGQTPAPFEDGAIIPAANAESATARSTTAESAAVESATAESATGAGPQIVAATPAPKTPVVDAALKRPVVTPPVRRAPRREPPPKVERTAVVDVPAPAPAPIPTPAATKRTPNRGVVSSAEIVAPTIPGRASARPEASDSQTFGQSAMVAPQAGGMTPLGGTTALMDRARTATRIVLQANTDSWLEVRAGEADPVYSGLLRQGDSYYVPEQPGLTLMTGNAGGIDILVDGRAIPKLGPPGAVKRDVVLDADRLLGQMTQQ